MIEVGSKWKCIDEDMEEFGMISEVLYVNDDPELNGEGGSGHKT